MKREIARLGPISTHPIPTEIRLRLPDILTDPRILELYVHAIDQLLNHETTPHREQSPTYIAGGRDLGVGPGCYIEPVQIRGFERDRDVGVVLGRGDDEVCYVVDVLLELIADPGNGMPGNGLDSSTRESTLRARL